MLLDFSWIGEPEINTVAKLLLFISSSAKKQPLESSPFEFCGILMAVHKGDILCTKVVLVHERPPGTKMKMITNTLIIDEEDDKLGLLFLSAFLASS